MKTIKKINDEENDDFYDSDNITRNKSHIFIMQCIYNFLICEETGIKFNLKKTLKNIYKKPIKNIDSFSKTIIFKIIEKKEEAELKIKKNLIGWNWKRVSLLSKSILIMSYVHFNYIEKINKAIIINIAVELAKKFLDDNEYKFINGILEKIL